MALVDILYGMGERSETLLLTPMSPAERQRSPLDGFVVWMFLLNFKPVTRSGQRQAGKPELGDLLQPERDCRRGHLNLHR